MPSWQLSGWEQSGKVIGVDMTLEMVQKAKANAEKLDISNVDFPSGKS